MNTIVAISSPIGAGAIHIVRLSGPSALLIASKIYKPLSLSSLTEAVPRYAYLGKLSMEGICDSCIAIFFKGPNSYTGEDIVELQCHGNIHLAYKIVDSCISNGATLASKGEFSKRAFLNNKITLAEAEGILDIISAESTAELKAASALFDGSFINLITNLQNSLLEFSSEYETSLDYPDEYDGVLERLRDDIQTFHSQIKKVLQNSTYGKKIKEGINVCIIGNPNAGKSSLLNAIIGENKAIVTDIPGTTRDIVSSTIEYKSIKINFFDTAGIRESNDTIEKIGIEKSFSQLKNSDVVIVLEEQLSPFDLSKIENSISRAKIIRVLNKIDSLKEYNSSSFDIAISAKKEVNIGSLLDLIYNSVIQNNFDSSGTVLTSLRHIEALQNAEKSIASFLMNYNLVTVDCLILDLKNAFFELGKITGVSANEEIINNIFERFCVGK